MLAALLLYFSSTQVTVVGDTSREEERLLTGRVVSPVGAAIAGAVLELRTKLPGKSLLVGTAKSGPDGHFSLQVDPGPEENVWRDSFLEVSAPGWAPSRLERVYRPPPTFDLGPIVLHPPVELRGSVTDADGKPVPGAAIHAGLGPVVAPYGDHAQRPPIAITDDHGNFACSSLPPGLVTVGAEAAGFVDRVLEPIVLRSEGTNRADFVLEPESIVRLRAFSGEAGLPPGVQVEPMGEVPGRLWSQQYRYQAFWRGAVAADSQGWITLHGLDSVFSGDVIVTAPDHRPARVLLTRAELEVHLEPTTWIEVVAERKDGGAAVDLYEVGIRDGPPPKGLMCGNCEDNHWAWLGADSPAVMRLAPNRWRIAWNDPACYVGGGKPSIVSAISTERIWAQRELPKPIEPGTRVECRLEFDAPARLSGMVRDPSGVPVSVLLGIQLSLHHTGWVVAKSGPDGRFSFDGIGGGPKWIHSLDDGWEVDEDSDRVEPVAGQALENVIVLVHPRPDGLTGRATGVVTIAGAPPREPVLLALDEVPNQHLPSAYPRGFAWTDAQGRFELGSFWPREYHLVPKHTAGAGGWRDFAAEFPAHDARWQWTVDVPASGTTSARIDFPPESEWDSVAPPAPDSDD